MPGLIPLIRKVRPEIPIIYRSHIEIRSDLVHVQGSPQEEVWKYLWNNIQHADMFISHPVNKFVPSDVPVEKLALLGAATDWYAVHFPVRLTSYSWCVFRLDGLNKELDSWDSQFYMGEFRSLCARDKMTELAWPMREYIVQIARFDPSKGIPNVIDSYARFRKLCEASGEDEVPQLLICGHGAVDDPDASIIYDQIVQLIHGKYAEYVQDIVVMRCPPSDQRESLSPKFAIDHRSVNSNPFFSFVQSSTRSWRTRTLRCSSRRVKGSRSRSPRRCTPASP